MADLDFLIDAGFSRADVEKAKRHFGDNANVEQVAEWILSGYPGSDADKSASKDVFVPETPPNQSGWRSDGESHEHGHSNTDISGWAVDSNMDEVHAATIGKEQLSNRTKPSETSSATTPSESHGVKSHPEAVVNHRAGQSSPVYTVSGKPQDSIIDLTRETPVEKPKPGLLALAEAATGAGSEEDDMQRAIRMSLEDQGSSGVTYVASAQMSHAVSASREEQESEQLAAALTASMADLEAATPAGGDMSASANVEVSPELRIRVSADAPVVLSPPGGYLAYVGPVMYSLFCNVPFRHAVLGVDVEWLPTFSYEDYADEVPAPGGFTRDLIMDHSNNNTLRVAALQRLFAFMLLTKRSSIGIVDLMDAFDIRKPDRPPLHALHEVKALHNKVCDAWTGWHIDRALRLIQANEMSPEVADAYLDQQRLLIFNQGCVANPSIASQYVNTGDKQALSMLPEQSTWLSAVDTTVYIGDTLTTYAALDAFLEQSAAQAFILRRGHSLYIHTAHIATSQTNGSNGAQSLFQIEPEIYLDRYDWQARAEILQYRKANYDARSSTKGLELLRSRLLTSSKTRRPIATYGEFPTVSSNGSVIAPDKAERGKGIINQALRKVTELADEERDLEKARQYARTIERLTGVLQLLEAEVAALDAQKHEVLATNAIHWPKESEQQGPYKLRSSIMWSGFFGRGSVYVYVQAGISTALIADEDVSTEKWWKVTDNTVEEVTFDTVVNDDTGIYLPGGGAISQAYVSLKAEAIAQENINFLSIMPGVLKSAIDIDNKAFASELPTELTKDWDLPVRQTNAQISVETSALSGELPSDAIMTLETQESSNALTTEEPLRLSGGASTLRSSIGTSRGRRGSTASDTGSVASTSRMKIGDFEDEQDSDDDVVNQETTELGFPVKLRKSFKVVKDAGKIGGKPIWLNPALPLELEQIVCGHCQQKMEFMLQINAPLDDKPQGIYRTLYVYSCRKASCLDKNDATGAVRVFRIQLPSENPYYDLDTADEQAQLQKFKDRQYRSLCSICKILHTDTCASQPWQEWLIETAPEEYIEDDKTTKDEAEAKMKAAVLADEDASDDVHEPDSYTGVDSAFLRFQERMRHEPNQILRYYYRDVVPHAEPLQVKAINSKGTAGVQACHCGEKRSCEFQILATILAALGIDDLEEDALDYGIVSVYTCDAACASTNFDEKAWKPPGTCTQDETTPFEQFRPLQGWGWQEEVAVVQNYSNRGVTFGRQAGKQPQGVRQ